MAQFFAYPLNYGGSRSQYKEVADNDYTTFTTQTSMLLHIDSNGDGTGTARDFTDIFVKCSGVTSYEIVLTDPVNITATPADRTLPASVNNDSGHAVDTKDLEGFQNDLHSLWDETQNPKPPRPQAKSVTLTFTAVSGETAQIYEVMILNRLLTLDSDGGFARIEYDNVSLGSVEADLKGNLSYVPPIGGTRDKWAVSITANSLKTGNTRDTVADELVKVIRNHKTFVFAPEYKRYPNRVFPAVFPNAETQIRYLNRWKGAGRRVSFTIREA